LATRASRRTTWLVIDKAAWPRGERVSGPTTQHAAGLARRAAVCAVYGASRRTGNCLCGRWSDSTSVERCVDVGLAAVTRRAVLVTSCSHAVVRTRTLSEETSRHNRPTQCTRRTGLQRHAETTTINITRIVSRIIIIITTPSRSFSNLRYGCSQKGPTCCRRQRSSGTGF